MRPTHDSRVLLSVIAAGLFWGAAWAEEAAPAPAAFDGAAPNTWVKLCESKTGGRSSPIFFYAPQLKRFVLTGGRPGGTYGKGQPHYSTEHFDLVARAWTNAYPEGAPYKNASGVTDAPASKGKSILGKDAQNQLEILRFASAYGTDTRAHNQWAFDPGSQTLYAYLFNRTIAYDVGKRVWSDLGAEAFSQGGFAMVWGSLCYDPVNKEVLSVGGSSAEGGGTPGTYAYRIAGNKWEKVVCGSEALRGLGTKAELLRREAWALLSLARNRYHHAETETEAQAKLDARRTALARDLGALASEAEAAGLKGSEADAGTHSSARLGEAKAACEKLDGRLDGKIDAEVLAALRGAHDLCEQATRALDAEPFGRAHAPMAYDAANKKIVLFGGSELDRTVNDTWVYDCATRTWAQRWPTVAPAPRAGHALVWMPKSKQVVAVGGYTIRGGFRDLPPEVWAYDTAANQWKLLLALPGAKRGEPDNAPAGTAYGESHGGAGSNWVAAANEDDVLVSVSTGDEGFGTWAAKIDPSKADEAGTKERGAAPDAASFSVSPLDFDQAETPDAARMTAFFKDLKPNTWTAAPKVAKKPEWRAWNTTTYDYDRQQWLWWGGGHVTYMGTEVAHYSTRTGTWSIGYNPDLPHAPTGGFYVKASLTFHDRPQVPVHAYQAYSYDPSGNMFMLGNVYNVAERQWLREPFPGLKNKGSMRTLLETTPHGVYALSEAGLFKFEAKEKAWKEQPWNGPKFGAAWCDGHAMCYDAKRDGLWIANEAIFRYDCKTGAVEKLAVNPPKALGKFALWREQCVIPDADLILLMRRFKAPGGELKNVAFDIKQQQYFWVDQPFPGKNDQNFSWSEAMVYDPVWKAVLLHDTQHCPGSVWALRFDKATAKLEPIGE